MACTECMIDDLLIWENLGPAIIDLALHRQHFNAYKWVDGCQCILLRSASECVVCPVT